MTFKKINPNVAIGPIPETESIAIAVRDREVKRHERWAIATCSKEDLKKILEEFH